MGAAQCRCIDSIAIQNQKLRKFPEQKQAGLSFTQSDISGLLPGGLGDTSKTNILNVSGWGGSGGTGTPGKSTKRFYLRRSSYDHKVAATKQQYDASVAAVENSRVVNNARAGGVAAQVGGNVPFPPAVPVKLIRFGAHRSSIEEYLQDLAQQESNPFQNQPSRAQSFAQTQTNQINQMISKHGCNSCALNHHPSSNSSKNKQSAVDRTQSILKNGIAYEESLVKLSTMQIRKSQSQETQHAVGMPKAKTQEIPIMNSNNHALKLPDEILLKNNHLLHQDCSTVQVGGSNADFQIHQFSQHYQVPQQHPQGSQLGTIRTNCNNQQMHRNPQSHNHQQNAQCLCNWGVHSQFSSSNQHHHHNHKPLKQQQHSFNQDSEKFVCCQLSLAAQNPSCASGAYADPSFFQSSHHNSNSNQLNQFSNPISSTPHNRVLLSDNKNNYAGGSRTSEMSLVNSNPLRNSIFNSKSGTSPLALNKVLRSFEKNQLGIDNSERSNSNTFGGMNNSTNRNGCGSSILSGSRGGYHQNFGYQGAGLDKESTFGRAAAAKNRCLQKTSDNEIHVFSSSEMQTLPKGGLNVSIVDKKNSISQNIEESEHQVNLGEPSSSDSFHQNEDYSSRQYGVRQHHTLSVSNFEQHPLKQRPKAITQGSKFVEAAGCGRGDTFMSQVPNQGITPVSNNLADTLKVETLSPSQFKRQVSDNKSQFAKKANSLAMYLKKGGGPQQQPEVFQGSSLLNQRDTDVENSLQFADSIGVKAFPLDDKLNQNHLHNQPGLYSKQTTIKYREIQFSDEENLHSTQNDGGSSGGQDATKIVFKTGDLEKAYKQRREMKARGMDYAIGEAASTAYFRGSNSSQVSSDQLPMILHSQEIGPSGGMSSDTREKIGTPKELLPPHMQLHKRRETEKRNSNNTQSNGSAYASPYNGPGGTCDVSPLIVIHKPQDAESSRFGSHAQRQGSLNTNKDQKAHSPSMNGSDHSTLKHDDSENQSEGKLNVMMRREKLSGAPPAANENRYENQQAQDQFASFLMNKKRSISTKIPPKKSDTQAFGTGAQSTSDKNHSVYDYAQSAGGPLKENQGGKQAGTGKLRPRKLKNTGLMLFTRINGKLVPLNINQALSIISKERAGAVPQDQKAIVEDLIKDFNVNGTPQVSRIPAHSPKQPMNPNLYQKQKQLYLAQTQQCQATSLKQEQLLKSPHQHLLHTHDQIKSPTSSSHFLDIYPASSLSINQNTLKSQQQQSISSGQGTVISQLLPLQQKQEQQMFKHRLGTLHEIDEEEAEKATTNENTDIERQVKQVSAKCAKFVANNASKQSPPLFINNMKELKNEERVKNEEQEPDIDFMKEHHAEMLSFTSAATVALQLPQQNQRLTIYNVSPNHQINQQMSRQSQLDQPDSTAIVVNEPRNDFMDTLMVEASKNTSFRIRNSKKRMAATLDGATPAKVINVEELNKRMLDIAQNKSLIHFVRKQQASIFHKTMAQASLMGNQRGSIKGVGLFKTQIPPAKDEGCGTPKSRGNGHRISVRRQTLMKDPQAQEEFASKILEILQKGGDGRQLGKRESVKYIKSTTSHVVMPHSPSGPGPSSFSHQQQRNISQIAVSKVLNPDQSPKLGPKPPISQTQQVYLVAGPQSSGVQAINNTAQQQAFAYSQNPKLKQKTQTDPRINLMVNTPVHPISQTAKPQVEGDQMVNDLEGMNYIAEETSFNGDATPLNHSATINYRNMNMLKAPRTPNLMARGLGEQGMNRIIAKRNSGVQAIDGDDNSSHINNSNFEEKEQQRIRQQIIKAQQISFQTEIGPDADSISRNMYGSDLSESYYYDDDEEEEEDWDDGLYGEEEEYGEDDLRSDDYNSQNSEGFMDEIAGRLQEQQQLIFDSKSTQQLEDICSPQLQTMEAVAKLPQQQQQFIEKAKEPRRESNLSRPRKAKHGSQDSNNRAKIHSTHSSVLNQLHDHQGTIPSAEQSVIHKPPDKRQSRPSIRILPKDRVEGKKNNVQQIEVIKEIMMQVLNPQYMRKPKKACPSSAGKTSANKSSRGSCGPTTLAVQLQKQGPIEESSFFKKSQRGKQLKRGIGVGGFQHSTTVRVKRSVKQAPTPPDFEKTSTTSNDDCVKRKPTSGVPPCVVYMEEEYSIPEMERCRSAQPQTGELEVALKNDDGMLYKDLAVARISTVPQEILLIQNEQSLMSKTDQASFIQLEQNRFLPQITLKEDSVKAEEPATCEPESHTPAQKQDSYKTNKTAKEEEPGIQKQATLKVPQYHKQESREEFSATHAIAVNRLEHPLQQPANDFQKKQTIGNTSEGKNVSKRSEFKRESISENRSITAPPPIQTKFSITKQAAAAAAAANGNQNSALTSENLMQLPNKRKHNYGNSQTPMMRPRGSRQSVTTTSLISTRRNGKKKINQYIRQTYVGEGKTAKVYCCINENDKKEYAMKIMNRDNFKFSSTGRKAYNFLESEIAILKKLDHPNVLTLYEIIDDPQSKKLFIITDYIKSGSLAQKMQKTTGGLKHDEARQYFQGLVSAVDYCHDYAHVLHRDIKPENILIDDENQVKLADFGVSQMLGEDGNDILTNKAGTQLYFSPEMCKGVSYSGKPADVWACGVVLYQMVMNRLCPFTAPSTPLLYEKIISTEPDYSQIEDEKLVNLLKLIFIKDPTQRATIQQIIEHPWMTNNGQEPMRRIDSNRVAITASDLKSVVTRVVHINRIKKNMNILLKQRDSTRTIQTEDAQQNQKAQIKESSFFNIKKMSLQNNGAGQKMSDHDSFSQNTSMHANGSAVGVSSSIVISSAGGQNANSNAQSNAKRVSGITLSKFRALVHDKNPSSIMINSQQPVAEQNLTSQKSLIKSQSSNVSNSIQARPEMNITSALIEAITGRKHTNAKDLPAIITEEAVSHRGQQMGEQAQTERISL